jgi:long-chain acyl-CoA synthetase
MASPDFGANLVQMFLRSAERGGDSPFLWAKREGAYRPWSWRTVAEQVRHLAAALGQQGVTPGDRVGLVAESRPEWAIADLAIMATGGITVPAYVTNTPADHAHVLANSGAVGVVTTGGQVAARLLQALPDVPQARFLIATDPKVAAEAPVAALSFQEALAAGESGAALDPRELGPDALACFIYTSGTGGRPKGVMLSHGNILHNMIGCYHLLESYGLDDEVFLSFLPLSHSYEHTAGHFFPMAIGAQIYYAEGIEHLSRNLVEARPTILTCVPRLYEVMRQRMIHTVERQGGLSARLFHKALDVGRRRYEGRLGLRDRILDPLLERLVRDKVRGRFGGRLKALVSGGAPLNYDVGLFFVALGLRVLQGYGQTESSPVISCNVPARIKLHTVGPPLHGVEVRIAADGEILVRGGLVMKGYWRDEATTAATIKDGWLHTGDIGHLDEDGYLVITDRKKDIIVNSGGDNVAPQRVEGVLQLQPEIAQAAVFGDRRPHLVGMVVPDAEFARGWAKGNGKDPDPALLAADPGFQKAINDAVARANRELSVIERVRRVHLVPEPFSVDNGMMTPTLKLKRHVIYERFQITIEDLYGPAA